MSRCTARWMRISGRAHHAFGRPAAGAAQRRLLRQRRCGHAVSRTDQPHDRRQSVLDAPAAEDGEHLYATLARGYKGGGFNIGSGILSEQRSFGPESLWSLEIGPEVFSAPTSPLQLQIRMCFTCGVNTCRCICPSSCSRTIRSTMCSTRRTPADGENYRPGGARQLTASTSRWQISGSAVAAAHTLSRRGRCVRRAWISMDARSRSHRAISCPRRWSTSHPAGGLRAWMPRALGSFYYYTSDAQASRAYHLENLRVGYQHGAWTASAVGPQSIRCPLCPAGILFRADPAELSRTSPFCSWAIRARSASPSDYDLPHERSVRVFPGRCLHLAALLRQSRRRGARCRCAVRRRTCTRWRANSTTAIPHSCCGRTRTDHDLRVRFFTPRREAAFVGHATLAAHAVLASLQLAPRPRQKQSSGHRRSHPRWPASTAAHCHPAAAAAARTRAGAAGARCRAGSAGADACRSGSALPADARRCRRVRGCCSGC